MWSATEDLGSVLREELDFCFQVLEGLASGTQKDLCLLPQNRDDRPRLQQKGLGKDWSKNFLLIGELVRLELTLVAVEVKEGLPPGNAPTQKNSLCQMTGWWLLHLLE